MFGITDVVTYFLAVVAVIILPGPNSLYCLSMATTHGKRAGFLAMTGIIIGDGILILATVLGAGTVLKLYPSIFDGIKLIGGAYLAYLGSKLLLAAYTSFKNRHQSAQAKQATNPPSKHNHFYKALTLSLTNPKAILFFLSFFVQFVEPSYDKTWLSFLILALILQVVSFSYLMLLIFAGQSLAQKFAHRPYLSILGFLLIGLLFVGFAINLWTSQL